MQKVVQLTRKTYPDGFPEFSQQRLVLSVRRWSSLWFCNFFVKLLKIRWLQTNDIGNAYNWNLNGPSWAAEDQYIYFERKVTSGPGSNSSPIDWIASDRCMHSSDAANNWTTPSSRSFTCNRISQTHLHSIKKEIVWFPIILNNIWISF